MIMMKEDEGVVGVGMSADDTEGLVEEDPQDPEHRCGFLCLTHPCLQKHAHIKSFVGVFSCFTLSYLSLDYYVVAIITTIERRFGLSSSQSGLLLSVREIAFLCTALLVSHFARDCHRPRFLAFTGITGAIGGYTYLLPHIAYDKVALNGGESYNVTSKARASLCLTSSNGSSEIFPGPYEGAGYSHQRGALVIFAIGSVLMGCSSSSYGVLSTTYVDDATTPTDSALYLGIIKSMYPFGPMVAFIFGGAFLSLHDDLQDPGYASSDPRWVGAWWLGYIVLPTIFLVASLVVPFFPSYLHQPGKSSQKSLPQEKRAVFISELKEFFKAISRLLKNPAYMLLVIGGCFSAFVISGLFPFLPKYIEKQFFVSASKANLLTGSLATLFAGVGIFLGGVMVSKYQWRTKHAALFVAVVNAVFIVGILLLMSIRCDQIPIVGIVNSNRSNVQTVSDTSASDIVNSTIDRGSCADVLGCGCSREVFQPVCGSDGVTYLSACQAGCTQQHENKTYYSCRCIAGEAIAQREMCSSDCWNIVIYMILLGMGACFGLMATIPGVTIQLRIVMKEDRSLAVGFYGTAVALASFIPGPVIYGSLIDSTCILWQNSGGADGACLLYNNDSLRYELHGVTALLKSIAEIFYIAVALTLWKHKRYSDIDNENTNKTCRPEENNTSVENPESPLPVYFINR